MDSVNLIYKNLKITNMKQLKTLLIATLVATAFSISSCKKIEVNETFDGAAIYFNVSPQLAGDFDYTNSYSLNINDLIKKYNVTLEDIDQLNIESATFSIVDTDINPVNFNSLDKIEMEMEVTSPGRKVMWKDPVPSTGQSTIDADVDKTVNYKDYATSNNTTVKVKGRINSEIGHSVKIKCVIKWRVKAGV